MEELEIKDILLKEHYVSAEDMARAEKFALENRSSVADFLLVEGIINKDLLGQAIAERFGIPYADLNSSQPTREQALKIPEDIAVKYRVVLFTDKEESLPKTKKAPGANGEVIITTDDPTPFIAGSEPVADGKKKKKASAAKVGEPSAMRELKKIFTEKNIVIAYSLPEDIEVALMHYRKSLETRFSEIIKNQKLIAPSIIDEIVDDAISFRASDVHFEPQEAEVVVRFRVDGVLREAGIIPKEQYENILNRIKVSSRMRIDEHNAAQDGAMRYARRGDVADMRVSVAPTLDGEKVAIRVLSHYVRAFTMGDLGLTAANQEILSRAAKKPFGMILVTGPTGSGKTTTLYALVKNLNSREINITTIEDPVEYKISGINQIQVNPQTNLTYAKGLKSIVRQDPDVILVGEIRDEETAEIAVNAALTGHLLFSTFHANDAATAIPRLLDMGVEPFLVASTLDLIIAQRLVRKICESCRASYTSKEETAALKPHFGEREASAVAEISRFYRGAGCNMCHGSGYSGRTALFECIEVTPQMNELILKQPAVAAICALSRAQGSRSMWEDGLEKVKGGVTTIEELSRVAQPPC